MSGANGTGLTIGDKVITLAQNLLLCHKESSGQTRNFWREAVTRLWWNSTGIKGK